jgi:hypothetical protein
MHTLTETANNLQKDAKELITSMQLNEKLTPFGDLKLVGSATYNLMTWRDVDFDLITLLFLIMTHKGAGVDTALLINQMQDPPMVNGKPINNRPTYILNRFQELLKIVGRE